MKSQAIINADLTFSGLSDQEADHQRTIHGANEVLREKNMILHQLASAVKEPMFILLCATAGVYFLLNQFSEAFTMLAALLFVAGIDVFQNFRSQKAIKALSHITESKAKVMRSGVAREIDIKDVVTGDLVVCEEGTIIPVDATILSSNDFSVNESLLTGESVPVEKKGGDEIYQGTLVVRGYCYGKTTAVGKKTTLAGIGKLVSETGKEKTPLQLKVFGFVRVMVFAGTVAFLFVWLYNWWESSNLVHGLLHGLTMAMSVLPEEIPVALSTFMALGAYRLLKHGVIARSPQTVETLGSATVVCLDKTGTLTQNLMTVANTYEFKTGEESDLANNPRWSEVLEYAMWASEERPFDPMEKSIHEQYTKLAPKDKRESYKMVKEFPLAGSPPVMTHVFQDDKGNYIIGCKGGLEGVLQLCNLGHEERLQLQAVSKGYAEKGQRVLAVAKGQWDKTYYPQTEAEIEFEFLGLISFSDPPDPHIKSVISQFYDAGVDVKMITGDHKETAMAIAGATGIDKKHLLSGNEISSMNDDELKNAVVTTSIFARVSPETKLRIITALKKAGAIVAMTGDGVNDAPALKAAHIGVAMGKRGTDVAKGAAGLVLSGDDLSKMVDAIFLGRRINENLTKAIRYIISIHIPIILLVVLPIFIGWLPAMLFSPIHVIFLELIMGPTCSIIYENEPIPAEDLKAPIPPGKSLLQPSQLAVTITQGIFITLGCIVAGYLSSNAGDDDIKVRTMVFSTLIVSNIFLTLVNRSFTRTIIHTISRRNVLIPVIIFASLFLLILILFVPGINRLFEVVPLQLREILLVTVIAFAAVIWIEPFKFFVRTSPSSIKKIPPEKAGSIFEPTNHST